MKPTIKDYIFLHLLLFLNTIGGACSKMAARQTVFSPGFFLFYSLLLLILIIYAIAWQQIIRRMPLSTAYLNKPVAILWGIVWGTVIFHEQITAKMVCGTIIVITGIIMVVRSNE